MSGDITSTPGRFIASNRKFSGSMNPGPIQGTRGAHARSKLLTSKVSAPRPINLPSLRRENASGAEVSTSTSSSPAIQTTGWGSPASSPFASPQQQHKQAAVPDKSEPAIATATSSEHTSPVLTKTTSTAASTKPVLTSDVPPKSPVSSPKQPRAWNTLSTVNKPASTSSPTDFPAASESTCAATNSNKDSNIDVDKAAYKVPDKDQPSEPSGQGGGNLDWDEIVRQDLESQTSQAESTGRAASPVEIVSPEDRFTEDYDRSYPPQIRQTKETDQRQPSTRTVWRDFAAENSQGSNQKWHHYGRYGNSQETERRRSSDRGSRNTGFSRRDFADTDRYRSRNHYDRRASQERRPSFQPTVILQSSRHMKEDATAGPNDISDTSSGINRPTEITAAQREVMLTAAERAKKRRDEEEAEYEAARERARKKAEALAAAMAEKKSSTPNVAGNPADNNKQAPATQNGSSPKASTEKDGQASEESRPSRDNIQASEKGEAAAATEAVSEKQTSKDQSSSSPDSTPDKTQPSNEPTTNEVSESTPEKAEDKIKAKSESDKTHDEKQASTAEATAKDDAKTEGDKKEIQKAKENDIAVGGSSQEDEDERRWTEYVNDVRDNKDSQQDNGGASAWAAYATRLQSQEEARWTSQIRRYAAERNKDPEFYEELRPRYQHQPLPRPSRSFQRKDNNRERQQRSDYRTGANRRDNNDVTNRQPPASEAQDVVAKQEEPVVAQADAQEESVSKVSSDVSREQAPVDSTEPETSIETKEKVTVTEEAPVETKKANTINEEAPVETKEMDTVTEEAQPSAKIEPKTKDTTIAEGTEPSGIPESKVEKKITQAESTIPTMSADTEESTSPTLVHRNWTRTERQDFLQKQTGPIFPNSLVIPNKPALLAFTFASNEEPTISDAAAPEQASPVQETQAVAEAIKDDGWGPPPPKESIANEDAWGSISEATETKPTADGWGAPPAVTAAAISSNDGWGPPPKAEAISNSNGWGETPRSATTSNNDGWGEPVAPSSNNGWGPPPSQTAAYTWSWPPKKEAKSTDEPAKDGWGQPPEHTSLFTWARNRLSPHGTEQQQQAGTFEPVKVKRREKNEAKRDGGSGMSGTRRSSKPLSPEAKPFTPESCEPVTPKDIKEISTERKVPVPSSPPHSVPWNGAYPMLVYAMPATPGAVNHTTKSGLPNGPIMQGIPGFTAAPNTPNVNFYFVPAPPPTAWYRTANQ